MVCDEYPIDVCRRSCDLRNFALVYDLGFGSAFVKGEVYLLAEVSYSETAVIPEHFAEIGIIAEWKCQAESGNDRGDIN